MASPIQIILNPENYEEARETSGGGPKKDFFANRDQEFRQHKAHLIKQLRTIAASLHENPQTDLGYVKVILRRSAWAKSHRPLKALFKPDRTPIIGGADLGVMLVEARPPALLKVADDIANAEDRTKFRFVEAQGKEIPYPSARRSETGAIERIEIYGESDHEIFRSKRPWNGYQARSLAAATRSSSSMYLPRGAIGTRSTTAIAACSSPLLLALRRSARD